MSSLFKYSPTKSPKRAFIHEAQSRPIHKRQSPGTLKKNHPYTDQIMSQSMMQDKSQAVLKQSLDELEYYKQKCRELETQLQNISVASGRLEVPLEAFARENTSLHTELEKISKQLAQKRNEAELWKQKYEN